VTGAWSTQVGRYAHTIRYLRVSQLISRLELRLAAAGRRYFPGIAGRSYGRRVSLAHLVWPTRLLQVQDISRVLGLSDAETLQRAQYAAVCLKEGRFEYFSESAQLGWPPAWQAHGKSRLWHYHLHYFDELVDLALWGDDPSNVIAIVENWIDANPLTGPAASFAPWHPYVASLRIVNWLIALSVVGQRLEIPESIKRSLVEHALFIDANLETDVGGNHLLKNLKAMSIAGAFWSGPLAGRWRDEYGTRFVAELGDQLLEDGCHFERSPSYHCQVLADAIEVASLMPVTPARSELLHHVARMDACLAGITHPDGDVALFNDSAFNLSMRPRELHAAASHLLGTAATALPPRLALVIPPAADAAKQPPATIDNHTRARTNSSGYVTIPSHDPSRFMVIDVGKVCPDDLPAHAHADLLSFELSVDGIRLIVDSGVGEYAAGQWRDYYRSTRAHNTVSVDALEQSDCWGSFRVGRRARPVDVEFRSTGGETMVSAAHTGFEHAPGSVRHHRTAAWRGDCWTIADRLSGSGTHSWVSYCHFHPEAEVVAHDGRWTRIARGPAILDVCSWGFSSGELVLALRGENELPANFGYALIPQGSRTAPRPLDVPDAPAV
jgi:uncharacterized heparinase superfamily protein